jgi:hypothetical protein
MPDMSRFFSPADYVSLAKNTETLHAAEAQLRTIRAKYLPILQEYTTPTNARKLLRAHEVQVSRLICGKAALSDFPFGSNSTEKLTDRLAAVHNTWLKYISAIVTESHLFEKYGTADANSKAVAEEPLPVV